MRRVLPCLLLLALIAPARAAAAPSIVGGTGASQTYPAQAEVSPTIDGQQYLCGGTLVAAHWVLTAGHCVTDDAGAALPATAFDVQLGSHTLDAGAHFAVDGVSLDPQWNTVTLEGDAALLHLTTAAPETPLAVATTLPAVGTSLRTIGWGVLHEGDPDVSMTLNEVDVPLVSDAKCATAYGTDFIAASMVCAGYDAGGMDACQGDSGGPLMAPTGDSAAPWTLVGIVSTGQGCARAGFYGIYTRVANPTLQGWLTSTITGVTPAPTPTPTPTPATTPTPSPTPVATPYLPPAAPTVVARAATVTLPKRCRAGVCKVAFDLPSGGVIRARLVLSKASARRLHRPRSAGSAVHQYLYATTGTLKLKLPAALRKRLRGRVTAVLTATTPSGTTHRTVTLTR